MLARLDTDLLRLARTRCHSAPAERFAVTLANCAEWGALWGVGSLLFAARDPARRPQLLRAATVAPLSVLANYAVKLVVRRPRPRLDGLPRLARASSELSFPSAHATSSFAAASAVGRISPAARPASLALAAAIALTRPYLGMHYPSDIAAGAILGIALGHNWPGIDGRSDGPRR